MAEADQEPGHCYQGLASWSCFLSVPPSQAALTSVPLNRWPPCQDLPC